MRKSSIERKTNETDIKLSLDIDGSGKSSIDTGNGFLDHMLTLFSRHGRFDLDISCKGDTEVDMHHTTEDIGICLGKAFAEAMGDMRGIKRYADIFLPMDEALVLCAVDISGRGWLEYAVQLPSERVGAFDTELAREFWQAFASNAGITLHMRGITGINTHHILEACFKGAGRAIGAAAAIDERYSAEIPSTKGVLL